MARSTLSIHPTREAPTTPNPSVATILHDHVSLSTSCIDRLYLNDYVPRLQSSGQLCAFLCDHVGNRIASPAAFVHSTIGSCRPSVHLPTSTWCLSSSSSAASAK